MAIDYITIKARIRDGKLEAELPENAIDGDIELQIPVVADETTIDFSQLSDEELDALITPNPKTGAEIIALGHTGGWEHMGITDSVEWVLEQRRKHQEKRGW